jgi:protein-L-isoaspartate(D-aspartate) O-methyltransferase
VSPDAAEPPREPSPRQAPIAIGETAVDRRRRQAMVANQLRHRDISDSHVLDAMSRVPRHQFVDPEFQAIAYDDGPLPIGHDQTISQPYIVALMTQLGGPFPATRALDVGTGSGYQAAVLAELVDEVYSVEIVKPLAEAAAARLARLGYANVTVRHGDGYAGWPEHAPYDVIILAAAAPRIPQALVDQLATGGRLILPVGDVEQQLIVIEKRRDGSTRQIRVTPVRFVPMTGAVREPPK